GNEQGTPAHTRTAIEACAKSLIHYAEHSFTASTFTGRVVTYTMSDTSSAVVAAIAALKHPLHGGANEAVMHNILSIDDPSKAQAWAKEKLANKDLGRASCRERV